MADDDTRAGTGDARTELRRRLLEIDPAGVRDDPEAAARCECACHPRPGGRVHPDGLCPCQFSPEERAERRSALERSLEALHAENTELWAEREAVLAQVAGELGVEAAEAVPAAPWVITGVVDGRAFYMRERWDSYSIVIAPDDMPGLDVWSALDEPGVLVREGAVSDLLAPEGQIDYRVALPFVVTVIRSELRRRTCPHPTRSGDQFCSRCGSPLAGTPLTGTRLSALAESWSAVRVAEADVVAHIGDARRGGDSWRVIAAVLDLTAREARDRYGSQVGE